MKRLLILILSLVSFNLYSQVRLNVMKPAAVNLGSNITSIAIIDRTDPEKEWVGIVEGIVTGEGIGLDKEAREFVISGLANTLKNSPKYVVITTPVKLKTPLIAGGFPTPLSWRRIEDFCNEYNTQAILSLEIFDSDFIITKTEKEEEVKDKDGKISKVKVFYAEGVGTVNIGYRIYDPKTKTILDEYLDKRSNTWSAKGSTPQAALASLLDRKAAINSISKNSGIVYGKRISPHWITVYRHYYRKPKKDLNFTTGVRQAQTNNWEGALESWQNAINSSHKKTAKRAMFNLALAYEVMGDLEMAKKYAADSYTIYNLKKGRSYVTTIEKRMWQEKRLEQQMK